MYRNRIFHLTTKTTTTTVSLPIYNPCMRHENGILLTGETFFVGGHRKETTFWLDSSSKQTERGEKWGKVDAADREDSRNALRDAMADDSKTTFCFGGGHDDLVASLIHLPQEAKQITLVHKAGATALGPPTGDSDSVGPELDKWGSYTNADKKTFSISPWIVAGKADRWGQEDTSTPQRRDGVAPLRMSYDRMKGHISAAAFRYKPKAEWGPELDSWGEEKVAATSNDLDKMGVRVRAQGGRRHAKSIDFRDGPLSSFPAGDYSVVIGENYFGTQDSSDDNQGVTCVQAIACVADVAERTPATATAASYFHHRRDDNDLKIKVCTLKHSGSSGRPGVYTYRHDDQGEPVSGLKLSPGAPEWGKYVTGPGPGQGSLVVVEGSTWSWKISTEVDSNIRLDFSREKVQPHFPNWLYHDGICISEVRTEDKVLTRVPFWLDTVCGSGSQADDYTGYYKLSVNEGRVKCWGPVREWGPFLNTRRALSLKTCGPHSGFVNGWNGKLTVELTMKGKNGRIPLPHLFDASKLPKTGLETAGLETSVLFDSTAVDGGTGRPVSIAEEELDSVKLTVAGTNTALCIEQIVYESMVLTNAPFLLDLKPANTPACDTSAINAKYGATGKPGIKQCYTESRVMKVSKSRLELRRCAEGWTATKGGRTVGQDKDEVVVKLQLSTRKRDNAGDADNLVSDEQVHVTWKPYQDSAESLIIPFVESEDVKEIEIEVVSPKDTMVCISEVKLGVYSEEVVVEKNSFLMVDYDNRHCSTRVEGDGTKTRTTLEVSGLDEKLTCYDRRRRLRIPPRNYATAGQCPHTEDFTARVDCASTSTSTAIMSTNWRGEAAKMEEKAQLLDSKTAALNAQALAAEQNSNCC